MGVHALARRATFTCVLLHVDQPTKKNQLVEDHKIGLARQAWQASMSCCGWQPS